MNQQLMEEFAASSNLEDGEVEETRVSVVQTSEREVVILPTQETTLVLTPRSFEGVKI